MAGSQRLVESFKSFAMHLNMFLTIHVPSTLRCMCQIFSALSTFFFRVSFDAFSQVLSAIAQGKCCVLVLQKGQKIGLTLPLALQPGTLCVQTRTHGPCLSLHDVPALIVPLFPVCIHSFQDPGMTCITLDSK